MNAGRVEQVGTAEEIYDHPMSAFVAAFIGKTNLVPGAYRGGGVVDVAGRSIRTADVPVALASGTSVYLCIRPHDVALAEADESSANGGRAGENAALRGRIVRATFLGDSREYLVELDTGGTLRATTRPQQRHAPGQSVVVALDPAQCRLLVR